jgi:methionyl-tRNA synthetase
LGEIAKADLKNIAWGGLKPGTRLGELGPVFPRAEKDAVARMKEIEEKNVPAASAAEEKVAKADEPVAAKDETAPVPGAPAVPAPPVTGTVVAPVAPVESVASVGPTSGTAIAAAGPAGAAAVLPVAAVTASDTGKISIDDFAKVELRVAQIKVAERVPKADKLLRLEVDLGYEQRQILAGIAEAYTPESLVGRKVVIVANLAPRKLRGLESNGMIVAASLEGGRPVLAGFLEDVEIGARLK